MNALEKILAQPKITHDLVQGTPEWDAFRLEHRGASEIAAAIGLSKNITRTELLHAKHTGIAREFSDFVQKRVLDKGHELEALARPHIEAMLGEDLYPVTCSRGGLSASCDGLTLDDGTAFEHKQWNEDLAAMVRTGNVPDEHMPQCQQILLVTEAKRVRFVVSDGTPERMVWVDVEPDRAWWERIAAAWEQFDADLATYQPPAVAEPVTAAPIEALPAVSVRMDGSLAVVSNLDVFGTALRSFIERIPKKPNTDQEFADAAAAVKALERAEEALGAAEASALGQVQSVEQLTRTIANLREAARSARLATNKVVEARKEAIRLEEVQRGKNALAAHIAGLNERLGRPYMPQLAAEFTDFGGAIKNKRTVESLRNAVDTLLAAAKIEAHRIADIIQVNLNHLRDTAGEFKHLFPDTATIVLKAPDDLKTLVTARIAEHRAAEEKRLEAERERIRAEEVARLEQERKDKEAAEARRREEDEAERRRAEQAAMKHTNGAPMFGAAVKENGDRVMLDDQGKRSVFCDVDEGDTAAATAPAPNVVPMQRPAAPAAAPALKLGTICERLGFTVTAEFMERLGYPVVKTDRGAKLFHERDWPFMLAALVAHLQGIQAKQAA